MEYFILLLAGSLCGIIMVLGGIILLYKGAISLANVSGEDAFTIEYKKELRISTQYPALGIFMIGLLFVFFSVFMGKPDLNKLVVKGKTVNVTEPVNISLKTSTWSSGLSHTGDVLETFYPNIDTIQIVVSAPGYDSHIKTIQITSGGGLADLGDFSLNQKIARSDLQAASITPLPPGTNIPSATFGGAQ